MSRSIRIATKAVENDGSRDQVDARIERSRVAILEAAAGLLIEGGASRVTIEGVAERSGVAKTTIYRHWRSRSQLVFDAFESLFRSNPGALEPGPLEVRLRRALTGLVWGLTESRWAPAATALIDAADRDPELRRLVEDFIERRMAVVRDVIVESVEAGELRTGLRTDLAVSMLAGPVFYRRLVSGELMDEAFIGDVVDTFLRAMRPGN
jgi:AcrR family transcriptional regulator